MSPLSVRRTVAGLGVLCLLASLLSIVPALMGTFSILWPLFAVAAAAGSVIFLRVSTVRERRARLEAAFAEALNAERAQLERVADLQEDPRIVEERARRRREAAVFDASEALTTADAEVLSAAAPAVESETEAPAVAGFQRTATWDPVEIPRPTYLSAPMAARHRPAPVTPEESSVTVPQQEQVNAVPSRMDLDEVLRRRRA